MRNVGSQRPLQKTKHFTLKLYNGIMFAYVFSVCVFLFLFLCCSYFYRRFQFYVCIHIKICKKRRENARRSSMANCWLQEATSWINLACLFRYLGSALRFSSSFLFSLPFEMPVINKNYRVIYFNVWKMTQSTPCNSGQSPIVSQIIRNKSIALFIFE